MATSGYRLGIDVGTTFTAAAVERSGRVEIVGLGAEFPAMPSAVFLSPDGAVLVGDAAVRRGAQEPDRLAREFKRRLGDPVPIIIGGTPMSAQELTATILRYVVRTVTDLEGGPPATVALTYPASWGAYKQNLFVQAARLAGVGDVALVSEPEAAAMSYAAAERVQVGDTVAVYDLGGGTFDAAVLRRTGSGFQLLGRPEGIDRLGGIDFDEAIVAHVHRSIPALAELDPEVTANAQALLRLRQDCVRAKEALSADTDVAIPVSAPGIHTSVRLTRAEFNEMIHHTLLPTIDATRRAISSAGLTPADLKSVLLSGGSSRTPAVAVAVDQGLSRPVTVDAHPKHSVALGAARTLATSASARIGAPSGQPPGMAPAQPRIARTAQPPSAAPPRQPAAAPRQLPAPHPAGRPSPDRPVRSPLPPSPAQPAAAALLTYDRTRSSTRRRRIALVSAVGAAVLAVLVLATTALGSGLLNRLGVALPDTSAQQPVVEEPAARPATDRSTPTTTEQADPTITHKPVPTGPQGDAAPSRATVPVPPCPPGQQRTASTGCQPVPCPQGQNRTTPDGPCGPIPCPAGQERNPTPDGPCAPIPPPPCATGQEHNPAPDGPCTPIPCPAGQEHRPAPAGPCRPIPPPPCPTGQEHDPAPDGPCRPTAPPPCPTGQEHDPAPDGPCAPTPTPPPSACPAGQEHDPAPDGPCTPEPPPAPSPCPTGEEHSPPPDGPCTPATTGQ